MVGDDIQQVLLVSHELSRSDTLKERGNCD